jgi:outer membrane cobalamin receptor
MPKSFAAILVACAAALPAIARAQSERAAPPPYRETVVVTGTAAPVAVEDLSRTVRVITREDIERLPARSIDDLLRLISSVDVRARGPHGVQADFAVRGAGFGQTLVLVDGARFNDAQSGHHNADFPVTLDQIDRIEVLLGPGSSIYGADAFGGTINIITRNEAGAKHARVAGGSYGLFEGRAMATWGGRVRQLVTTPRLNVALNGSVRAHRDHFLWDVNRPGYAENFHRSYATMAGVAAQWKASAATDVRFGGEGAGDWIRSSNLGDHDQGRGAGYVEAQQHIGGTATVSGALRVDAYSTFGTAASPGAGASWWVRPAVRLRSSFGRAFRVPTFTERYYTDPAHQATAELDPESAWTVDAALDWFAHDEWVVSIGGFDRHERDVIDWVRARPTDKWQTTNIHRVRTSGLEVGVKRVAPGGVLASVDYTWLSTIPDDLDLLSKYTLDYARHSFVVSAAVPLPAGFSVGGRADARARTARDAYLLVDLRATYELGPVRLFVDGLNLLDADYEEIRGVAMPGRTWAAGLDVLRW